jgi:two-component system sensor histidine kinase YesM
MKAFKERFLDWRNRTTIRKQLSLTVGLAVSLTMALLIMFSYFSQVSANTQRQVLMLHRVLEMELANLDKYVEELRAFSLQLRNHAPFMELVVKTAPLNYTQRQTVESALKTSFYSRSDVDRMDLYLIRQRVMYSLAQPVRKIALTEGADPKLLPDYEVFTAKPDFCSVTPAEDGFLEVTRTIIDSPRETPLAVVRFTVNSAFAQALESSHAPEEQLCVFGTDGALYFLPASMSEEDVTLLKALASGGAESAVLRLGGRDTLCVVAGGSAYGFTLIGMKPMSVVNAPLIATRNGSILLGLISLALTVLMVIYSIKFVTTPLSKLAHRLRRVGTGNFTTKAALDGSYEIRGLSEDVNQMMDSIQELIESTYVAQLSERTAQLVALEAQTNPHFLFNTLQAISTQAIVSGQEEIYGMVTSLAALLRYSVKGGNLAALETEFDHVEKYLSLQKARFGDRLTYECSAEPNLLPLAVPKLGLLSLAENSITHGLKGGATEIRIRIRAEKRGGDMLMEVWDDGCGIEEGKLAELRGALAKPNVVITQNIGLMNLASRLKLLYDDRARIEIRSRTAPPRETVVSIAIPLEVLQSVQGAAD